MKPRVIAISAAAVVLILVAVYWVTRTSTTSTTESDRPQSEGRDGESIESTRAAVDSGSGSPPEPSEAPEERLIKRLTSPEVAEQLRQRIAEARRVRSVPSAIQPQVQAQPSQARGELDPQYIRDAVQAIRPLMVECYELALDAAEREGEDPPEGRLVATFTISGEPEVGGVVEESGIDDESEIQSSTLNECMRETLYTLELPPPDNGGFVEVRYPFVFRNDDAEQSQE